MGGILPYIRAMISASGMASQAGSCHSPGKKLRRVRPKERRSASGSTRPERVVQRPEKNVCSCQLPLFNRQRSRGSIRTHSVVQKGRNIVGPTPVSLITGQ